MTGLPEWILPWAVVLSFLAAPILVIAAALLERSSPIRLHHWAEHAGGRLNRLYGAPAHFNAYRLLLSLLARLAPVIFVATFSLWLQDREVTVARWITVTILLLALFLGLLEWFNRYLVERHAEAALERSTWLFHGLAGLLLPLIWLLALFTIPVTEETEEDEDAASDDEIDAYIDVGVKEGILEPEEEELVRSIVDFGDTQVRSVMTPRVEVKSAPVDADFEDLAGRFFMSKHSRLPLYHESIDHIVGILHIRELFEAMHRGEIHDAGDLAHPPLYVPENKPLRDLLQEMQTLHQQMAIVVDEYGGVAGLVTVEDLLEEIVGEISDEHEPHESTRKRLGDHHWRLAGRTSLEDLEDLFTFNADDIPYETVSGLICGELGLVPKVGDDLETHGLIFKIEDADERRVTLVQVRSANPVGEIA